MQPEQHGHIMQDSVPMYNSNGKIVTGMSVVEGESVLLRSIVLGCPVTANKVSKEVKNT